MKTPAALALALLCVPAFTGCKTHVPMVQYHAPTYQKQTEAAAHWQWLASEACLNLDKCSPLAGKTIWVQPPPPGASEFEAAYGQMLRTELVRRSWHLVETPEPAQLRLTFGSQFVEHGARGFVNNQTTLWGTLGAGVQHFFSGDADVTGWNNLSGDTDATEKGTRKELIVTFFVHEGGQPVLANSQLVYVTSNDGNLYLTQAALAARQPHTVSQDPQWQQAEAQALAR
jgi:hypothetical protein